MDMDINSVPDIASNSIDFAESQNVTNVAFIWLSNTAGQSINDANNTIKFPPGVHSIELSKSKASVLMVTYDRKITTANTILKTIRQNGYEALLFGC